jgi:hypothetical protein
VASCLHAGDVAAAVVVTRLVDDVEGLDGTTPATGYRADVTVWCAECHEDFRFLGVPGGIGLHPGIPTVSPDGTELRAPIGIAR